MQEAPGAVREEVTICVCLLYGVVDVLRAACCAASCAASQLCRKPWLFLRCVFVFFFLLFLCS